MEELVRYKSRKGTNDVRALESNKTTCLADEDNRSLIPIDRHEIESKVSGENQSADKLDFRIVPSPGKLDGMNGDPFAQLREEILPFLKLRFEFVRRKKKNLAIYFRRAESKFGKNRLLSIPRVIPNSSQFVDARSIERIRNGATPYLFPPKFFFFPLRIIPFLRFSFPDRENLETPFDLRLQFRPILGEDAWVFRGGTQK